MKSHCRSLDQVNILFTTIFTLSMWKSFGRYSFLLSIPITSVFYICVAFLMSTTPSYLFCPIPQSCGKNRENPVFRRKGMEAGKWPASQAPRVAALGWFGFISIWQGPSGHWNPASALLQEGNVEKTAVLFFYQSHLISLQWCQISKITCDLNGTFRFLQLEKAEGAAPFLLQEKRRWGG